MNDTRSRQPWYQAYCVAMLQTDENKVLRDVEHARKVIEARVAELSFDPSNRFECAQLHQALHFLTMLLECCWREESSYYSADQTLSPAMS